MYHVAYDESWWLPDRIGFTQLVRQPLATGQSLLVLLSCSQRNPQPVVQEAGIYVGCEHADGPYWRLVESVVPTMITLVTTASSVLHERAIAE